MSFFLYVGIEATAGAWISLIASTARRLGDTHAANGVGFQIAAAAIGQSSLPAMAGIAARRTDLAVVPIALAVAAFVLCLVLRALDAAPEDDGDLTSLSPAPLERARGRRRRAPSRRT